MSNFPVPPCSVASGLSPVCLSDALISFVYLLFSRSQCLSFVFDFLVIDRQAHLRRLLTGLQSLRDHTPAHTHMHTHMHKIQ